MPYALLCSGFPPDTGDSLEADVEQYLQDATGCDLVGVSVCWDFTDKQDDVMNLAMSDVWLREAEHASSMSKSLPTTPKHSDDNRYPVAHLFLFGWIDWLLGVEKETRQEDVVATASETGSASVSKTASISDPDSIVALLSQMRCSGDVFAVFATEKDRNLAISALRHGVDAKKFRGQHKIWVTTRCYEPETVVWKYFGISDATRSWRLFAGMVTMVMAIVLWGVLFYGPYAYYEESTFAILGQAPSFANEMTFTLLVVIGNQMVYFWCQFVTDRVGFRFVENQHAAYIVCYVIAILVNLVFDLYIVIHTTYLAMVSNDVRTNDGTLLGDLEDLETIFQSYPMVKALGRMLYDYNFPSCFLIPFLAEGIFAIWLPYHLGCRIIGTRPVSLRVAEQVLAPVPMDLLRYADIILNVTQACLALFLTSGWIAWNFAGLLLGHIFIYGYDHWRVLRQTASFYFASDSMEMVAQDMMALPCAVLAACAVYHGRGLGLGGIWRSMETIHFGIILFGAFALHLVLHLMALRLVRRWPLVTPRLEEQKAPYSEVASRNAANWFTVNPVHCLRSKYVHRHQPPCLFHAPGKAHLIEHNEDIGLHFKPSPRGQPNSEPKK